MIYDDNSEDASWAAYALLIGKALSCARDSEKTGDLSEAGAYICMHAANHIQQLGWPQIVVVLVKVHPQSSKDKSWQN